MCGILGYSGQFDSAVLSDGLRAIAHRGPDDSGLFVEDMSGVGLGHVRLSILDLSTLGHQPMVSADGSVVLVFNGEIYNFRELRVELEVKGFVFHSHSDTEVLLNLYLAEGEGMMPRINGIFSFALWDKRSQSLLIARDALGVKPLYYSTLDGRFAFGSEIKGLLRLVPEARDLDTVALHRYLSFLWCPGDGTPLKDVRKLMPGEAMLVRFGSITRRWRWYHLPVFQPNNPIRDEKVAIGGTIETLRRAVHRQMVADVSVGAFLSGGLDSSAVVAFARELNPDIHCFTIKVAGSHEKGATDDLPYARMVAKHLGVALDVVTIDAARMAGDLESMVEQLDEPLADPAPLNVLYISRLARQKGMKVLLSGAGGDDLFTGYRRHRAVQAERYWDWLPLPVRQGLESGTSAMDQRNPVMRRLTKLFDGATLSGDYRLVNYFRWAREADLHLLYTPEFQRSVYNDCSTAPMLDFLKPFLDSVSPLDRMLALEQRFFLADHNLVYTDKMSMAAGVEVRVPFLDLDLVDFAARVPVEMKQRGKDGKWLLKKAMDPYLPHEVIYRPKSGFGAPLRHWMQYDLRELMHDVLSTDSLRYRGLFEPSAVHRLIAANDEGRADASYTLLSLLCIEIWCRKFLDQKS
jgi:asparagine synthase (glutamine-hydrolysing)